MKNKVLKYLLLSSCLVLLFGACRKDAFKGTETGSSGKTYVWLGEAPQYSQYFLPFTDVKPVAMFTVRRDAASQADLQKTGTATLTAISVDAYNAANGTTYSSIPSTLATQSSDKSVVATATGLTINFQPGDFAKQYVLNVNGTQFDASKKYAVIYALTGVGAGLTKKVAPDTIVSVFGVKNQYDGSYHATGERIHPALGTLPFDYNVNMVTSGATSIDGPALADLQADLNLTVNPDNTVTCTSTYQDLFVPAGMTNTYDPATQTFTLHVAYNTGAPRIMNITLKRN
jgi:hypothetical protein